jgi:hypothetical protein
MEQMRRIAFEVVQRACLFGSLAIFCVMVGMSFEPRLAFQAGGTLTTLMVLILLYKAREARTKDYRRTEMWLYRRKTPAPRKRTHNGRAPRSCAKRTSLLRCGLRQSLSRCGR